MKIISFLFDLFKRYNKFIKYCLVGTSGVVIDYSVFFVLSYFFKYHYLVANIFGVFCGMTTNFFLNAFFTFRVTSKLFYRFLCFFSVGILGLLLSMALLFLLVQFFHISSYFSKISSPFFWLSTTTFFNFSIVSS